MTTRTNAREIEARSKKKRVTVLAMAITTRIGLDPNVRYDRNVHLVLYF